MWVTLCLVSLVAGDWQPHWLVLLASCCRGVGITAAELQGLFKLMELSEKAMNAFSIYFFPPKHSTSSLSQAVNLFHSSVSSHVLL